MIGSWRRRGTQVLLLVFIGAGLSGCGYNNIPASTSR